MKHPVSRKPSPCGVRLREARELAGVPARTLSLAAGASSAVVGQIENGRVSSPKADVLNSIAKVLGISIEWLVAGQGKPPTLAQLRGVQARIDEILSRPRRRTGTDG